MGVGGGWWVKVSWVEWVVERGDRSSVELAGGPALQPRAVQSLQSGPRCRREQTSTVSA